MLYILAKQFLNLHLMNVISLFSGAGGLDLGLVQAGHKIVWANDNDADCERTYIHNLGDHFVLGDISKISSSEIPDGDVVVGGFPCQGFSLANKLRSKDDERNVLYKEFKRVVSDKQPLYFLAENVRGILSLDNGEAIKTIVKEFNSAGYRVSYKVFNTADYGVPQTRTRVIIAGTRKDLPSEMDYKFPEPTHNKNAESGLEMWVSIEDALKNIPEPGTMDSLNITNHIFSKYKVTNRNFTGHRKTDPTKPSPTILARGNGKGGVCAIQHPNGHRRMSVRESALIQSFPLDFEFFGSMSSMYRQVGNAVPAMFAKKLGEKLLVNQEQLLCA